MEGRRQLPIISEKAEVLDESGTDYATKEASGKAGEAHSNDGTMDLYIEGETFATVRKDFNQMLQKLTKNMLEKDSDEGSITLKLSVNMPGEDIPDTSSGAQKSMRRIRVPSFQHKITTGIVLKESEKGNVKPGMELYWDQGTGTYKLRYISNTSQMSIFDDEFNQQGSEDPEDRDADDTITVDENGVIVPKDLTENRQSGSEDGETEGNVPEEDVPEKNAAEDQDQNPERNPEQDQEPGVETGPDEKQSNGDALSAEAESGSDPDMADGEKRGDSETDRDSSEEQESGEESGDDDMSGLFGSPVDDTDDDAEYPDPDLDQ